MGSSVPPIDRRDRWTALLILLTALLVYNANFRLIAAGDTYPARFIPFALWGHGTVYLDPVLDLTIQKHPAPYWVQNTVHGRKASMYAVTTPILVAPFYLPAVLLLESYGWTERRVDLLGQIMEKVSASIVASLAVAWMFLLLRRRAGRGDALLLTGLFAFGTSTWTISSQALWQHGVAELLGVAALWFLTGERTPWNALAGGLATGLLVANRPPDLPLALAFGVAGLLWAGRRLSIAALFAAASALPLLLTVAYNLITFSKISGGYGQAGVVSSSFFSSPPLEGIAGLLVSPARGLFVYSPFLLFLPILFHRSLRDRTHRTLTLLLAGGVFLLLLVYAPVDFRQGFVYGPRFLADALPILIWMLAPVLPTLGPPARALFGAAGMFAVWLQIVGAFQYTGKSNLVLFEQQYYGPGATRAAWSLRHAPFVTELREPRPPQDVLAAVNELLHPPPPPPPPRVGKASDFYTVTPCRIVDTRPRPPLASGQEGIFAIAGGDCGIPRDAVAIAGTLTTLGERGTGTLLLRADRDRGALEIHFKAAQPRSLQVLLPLAPDGTVTVTAAGYGRTHLVVDVSGYFVPSP